MRLLLTAVLAVGLAVGAAYYLGWLDPNAPQEEKKTNPEKPGETDSDYGERLYPPAADPAAPSVAGAAAKADPLTIPASLVVFDKKKTPSQRDGVLLFIGTEVDAAEVTKPGAYKTYT